MTNTELATPCPANHSCCDIVGEHMENLMSKEEWETLAEELLKNTDAIEQELIRHEKATEILNKTAREQISDLLHDEFYRDTKLSKPTTYDYYTAADIAKILTYAQSTVLQRTVKQPDFPQPVTIKSSDNGEGGKRWLALEVHAWIKKQR